MRRMDRVRRQMVSRIIAGEAWVPDGPRSLAELGPILEARVIRHLSRQTLLRRQQIVGQLLEMSAGDFERA